MTDLLVVTSDQYFTLVFLLGLFVTSTLALATTCAVIATKRAELALEVKELRKRLESYMLRGSK